MGKVTYRVSSFNENGDLPNFIFVSPDSISTPLEALAGATLADYGVDALGFSAGANEVLILPRLNNGPVGLIGLANKDLKADEIREVGALIGRASYGFSEVVVSTIDFIARYGVDALGYLVEGIAMSSYRFDKYKSDPKELKKASLLSNVTFLIGEDVESSDCDRAIAQGEAISDATKLARTLVNEPAGFLTPTVFAQMAEELFARDPSISIEVWDGERIQSERLGALLGVAAGSSQEPRVVKLTYAPANATQSIALVGKGITFDSGGLNIKSFDGMKTMKTDMGGAAAVISAMSVLGRLNVTKKVIGFAMLTENMPSGSATKPGDVLTTRSGKTIEVLNTDAEGRLVLSDGLTLASEESPDYIVDLATLTGACVVALGTEIAGVLGNSDELISRLIDAGEVSGEALWELPIPQRYKKHIRSEIADMRNIGEAGQAGATAGAMLLSEFVEGQKWAHLDIAGPSRSDSDRGYISRGGTGFGARLLCYLLLGSL